MAPRRWRAEDGFSLAESVVASAILATAMLSIAQLLVLAAAANRASRDVTFASIVAAQKLEELRNASQPDSGSDTVDRFGRHVAAPGAADSMYQRRWTVTAVPDAAADVSLITVVVAPDRNLKYDADDRPVFGEVRLTGARMGRMP